MEKAPNAPRFARVLVVLVVALVCAAVVGGVLVVRGAGGSGGSGGTGGTGGSGGSGAGRSGFAGAARPVPTTAPYNPRPGPGGTRILTEPVDVLSVAVPNGWRSPATDALTLPGEINQFAAQAAPMAALLTAESKVAEKSAIRLFAYQPVAPNAFVSVVSFSSPGATAPSQSAIDAIVALAKKKTSNVAVSGVKLPVGQVIKLDSTLVSDGHHLVVEVLVLVAGGRTIQIQMVSETDVVGIPPLFDQIAQSLRLG
jgi:hypothetical protein